MTEVTKNLLIVVFAVALIVAVPFINIWAVNTLFGLGIAYTFWTWLASLILAGLFGRGAHVTKK